MIKTIAQRYEVLKTLGEGASGEVYLVRDSSQELVLKLLKKQLSNQIRDLVIEAFRHEFFVLKDIVHPHVVRIFDFGEDEATGRLYFTQERIQGENFFNACRESNPAEMIVLATQALEGLAAVQDRGLIHGDIKPANLLVDISQSPPMVKLIDFGMSYPGLVARGGTPKYWAPEKLTENRVDLRSDLYSLGVLLYETFAGANPFARPTVKETLDAHLYLVPKSLKDVIPGFDRAWSDWIDELIAKNPSDRPPNARTLLEQVYLAVKGGEPSRVVSLTAPFMGRAAELKIILSALTDDQRHLFCVTGPYGVGKSRFLQELKYRAQMQKITSIYWDRVNCGVVQDFHPVMALMDDWETLPDQQGILTQLADCRVIVLGVEHVPGAEAMVSLAKQAGRQSHPLIILAPFDAHEFDRWLKKLLGKPDLPAEWAKRVFGEAKGNLTAVVDFLVQLKKRGLLVDPRGQLNLSAFIEGHAGLATWEDLLKEAEARPVEGLVPLDEDKVAGEITFLEALGRHNHFAVAHGRAGSLLQLLAADVCPMPPEQRDTRLAQLYELKGHLELRQQNWDQAEKFFTAALQGLKQTGSDLEIARLRLHNHLAFILLRKGEGTQALEILEGSYAQWLKLLPQERQLVPNLYLGQALFELGRYQQAMQALGEELIFYRGLSDPSYEIYCLYLMAEAAGRLQDGKSGAYYRDCIQLAQQHERFSLLLRAYNGYANILAASGDYRAAIEYYDKGENLALFLKDYASAAAMGQNQGVLIRDHEHDGPRAVHKFENSLALLDKVTGPTDHEWYLRARSFLEWAETTRQDNEFKAAADLLAQARAIVQTHPAINFFHFWVRLGEADLALAQGAFDQAEASQGDLDGLAKSEEEKANRDAFAARLLQARCADKKSSLLPALKSSPPSAIKEATMSAEDYQRLQAYAAILKVNRYLTSDQELSQLLTLILTHALDLSQAESGIVLLTKEDGDLQVACHLNIEVDDELSQVSRSVAHRVLETGTVVRTDDAMSDDDFKASKSVFILNLRSVLCVPIRARNKIVGVLYLTHRFQSGVFKPWVEEILMAFGDQAGLAIESARLITRTKEQNVSLSKKLEQAEERAETFEEIARKSGATRRYSYDSVVAVSEAMQKVFDLLDRVIDTPLTVFIHGESGTGKELIAKILHHNSNRRAARFVALNCGALPPNLVESELFGHKAGSFTGAVKDKKGLFEVAHGGTIFLDEIGDLKPELQVKLLRVLQEREVIRVGDTQPIPIDVRVVAASLRNLHELMAEGQFREDLFYRICEIQIDLPPLRARREDVPVLARYFVKRYADETKLATPPQLATDVMNAFYNYDWPGNVRELENMVRVACALARGNTVRLKDLPERYRQIFQGMVVPPGAAVAPAQGFLLPTELVAGLLMPGRSWKDHELLIFGKAMLRYGFEAGDVAKALDVGLATVYNKLNDYKLKERKTEIESHPFRYEEHKTLDDYRRAVFNLAFAKADNKPYQAAKSLDVSPATFYKWVEQREKIDKS